MKLPFIGQQVLVHFIDSSLNPVIFAGWCIDIGSSRFTLTDGYSIRQFFLKSPLLQDVSPLSLSWEDDYFNRIVFSDYDGYTDHIDFLAMQANTNLTFRD